jgi:hypothetical protein
MGVVGRLERLPRRDGQQAERGADQDQVDDDPNPRPQDALAEVGVCVAAEEHGLEEQHARGPHRRPAAEPRQHRLADQRLDLEEQEGAEEDRRREHDARGAGRAHDPVRCGQGLMWKSRPSCST